MLTNYDPFMELKKGEQGSDLRKRGLPGGPGYGYESWIIKQRNKPGLGGRGVGGPGLDGPGYG